MYTSAINTWSFIVKPKITTFFLFFLILFTNNLSAYNQSTKELRSECELLHEYIEFYTEITDEKITLKDKMSARKIFNFKLLPKHRKWIKYCTRVYNKKDVRKEKKKFLLIRKRLSQL